VSLARMGGLGLCIAQGRFVHCGKIIARNKPNAGFAAAINPPIIDHVCGVRAVPD
jgi:hypothetical protein